MAQDFYAAFGVGEDERYISTVDADGVAFAAIQGLHQLVEQKDAEITTLKMENATQEARIAALESEVTRLQAERGAFEARLAALESSATTAGSPLFKGLVLLAGVVLAGSWLLRRGRATRRRVPEE